MASVVQESVAFLIYSTRSCFYMEKAAAFYDAFHLLRRNASRQISLDLEISFCPSGCLTPKLERACDPPEY
jgi:hypothetical protein